VGKAAPGSKMAKQSGTSGLNGFPKVTDDVVPEELEKKKRLTDQLNESTYYSTRGTKGVNGVDEMNTSYFAQLKNNVQTILGVKENQ